MCLILIHKQNIQLSNMWIASVPDMNVHDNFHTISIQINLHLTYRLLNYIPPIGFNAGAT